MSSHFPSAGYRQRRGGDYRRHCPYPFLSHSLGLDDKAFGWQRCIARSFLQWLLHADRHSACVDRLILIAVQQATNLSARSGSVVTWYFDFGFAGFVIAWYVSNLVGGTMYWWFAARITQKYP